MAYNSDNTVEVWGTVTAGDFREFRISGVKNKSGDLEAVDIRTWYCTKADSTMKPTQKGVRIGLDDMNTIMDIIKARFE